ncbi:MAG TPA: UbiD family decarboxylase, partial [Bacteroidota bacterium]
MPFSALGEFVRYLESIGELHRVKVDVDPRLELTEIATRALQEKKPALFFEKVKDSRYPVAMNVYASERRIEHALGKHPEQFGDELVTFFERALPPKPGILWQERSFLRRVANARASWASTSVSQEVVETPNLDTLPIQICWPKDGGRFVTMGQV